MGTNKFILDRFFDHFKWVVKVGLFLVLLLIPATMILVNSAQPNYNEVIVKGNKASEYIFQYDGGNSAQLIIAPIPQNNGNSHDNNPNVEIELWEKTNGNWTFVKNLSPSQVIHFESLERRTYKLVLTNNESFEVRFHIVLAHADLMAIILFLGILSMFGVFIIIAQISIPLYFVFLVITLIWYSEKYPEKVMSPSSESQIKNQQTFTAEDFAVNDKAGFIIALALFFIGVAGNSGGIVIFSIIIAIGTWANMQNRYKLKRRILNLLDRPPYPATHSLDTISDILQADPNKVENMIMTLILDYGYPMEYDKATKQVKVLSQLRKVKEHKPDTDQVISSNQPVQHQTTLEPETQVLDNPEIRYCNNCGVELPKEAIFCHNCGTKNQ